MNYSVCSHITLMYCPLLFSEPKAEVKDEDSDSEEPTRGADSVPAVASQPQRVALFPGMDPLALKVNPHVLVQRVITGCVSVRRL